MKRYTFLFFLLCNALLMGKQVSIIIPCHHKHAEYLENLLRVFEKQTLLPDEVVISISGANNVKRIVDKISRLPWKFQVKIITSFGNLTAGQNRNVACSHATGDIFICQDADDIPHPQRVEIIHYFFEKYDLDHLQHKWDTHQQWVIIDDITQIRSIYIEDHKQCYGKHYVQGTPAISPRLFEKLKWSDLAWGEDTQFNGKAYEITKNRLLIPIVLYQYRRK